MNAINPEYSKDQVTLDPYTIPLENIDVSNPHLFAQDAHGPWFKRLRDEDPVHYCRDSFYGPYWSVTRYKEIMEVDTSRTVYDKIVIMRI